MVTHCKIGSVSISQSGFAIEFKQVSKKLGGRSVLNQLSLALPKRGIYSLVGESGSGKTTLLRLINGLLSPDEGEVRIDGRPINYGDAVNLRRHMGYCIQGSGLFPHMTVYENISLVARRSKWNKDRLETQARSLLQKVSLPADQVWNKKPNQLSGGQRQRVGIARALFMQPKLMLMDEAFGALDPMTREEIQDFFVQLQRKEGLTVVMVTHDMAEAFRMSDEVIILNQGSIEQQGTPKQVLSSPSSQYVSAFLNSYKEMVSAMG